MKQNLTLSFIIPAYNEEENIANTISSIKSYTPNDLQYEILVIDHSSTDETARLALEGGAQVYSVQGGTVAGLRNYGASKASGDILIFLDADILLTDKWSTNIDKTINNLLTGSKIITGSWVSISNEKYWIEKYWFEPQQKISNTHINSGHLILRRSLFDELQGFSERLETGEDYDISMRAKKLGIKIVDDSSLVVIHEGYPKSLWQFIRREFWHAKGDVSSFKDFVKSKVAILSALFSLLHVLAWLFLFLNKFTLLFVSLAGILFICSISSVIKFKNEKIIVLLVNTFVYYFYFLARSTAFIKVFGRGKFIKRKR